MSTDEADTLQTGSGNATCVHADLIAGRDEEPNAGKWQCLQCGSVVDYDEWQSLLNKRP